MSETSTDTRPTARWAHEVAPAPDGLHYLDPNRPAADLPTMLAKHHIARAYAFWLGTSDGDWLDGIGMMLNEYHLATVWCAIATTDALEGDTHGDALAVEIVTDLASPHVIGPNILEMLAWADIEPEELRAFGPERAGSAT